MKLKWTKKAGQYGTTYIFVNGFRIGHLSWSTTRNDLKPHCAYVSLAKESNEQFETQDEALRWIQEKVTATIEKLAGIEAK